MVPLQLAFENRVFECLVSDSETARLMLTPLTLLTAEAKRRTDSIRLYAQPHVAEAKNALPKALTYLRLWSCMHAWLLWIRTEQREVCPPASESVQLGGVSTNQVALVNLRNSTS
jgi:hypothetical protein